MSTPRDRNGEFEPKILPINSRTLGNIEDKVISMYAKGLNFYSLKTKCYAFISCSPLF
ncbi:MAG: transposase [Lachnospirales bacterium]